MKNQLLRLAVLGTMTMGLAVATASAQSRPGVSVEVPFAFVVNGTAIEPGSYLIEAHLKGSSEILEIQSRDGRPITNVLTQSLSSPGAGEGQPKLVFNRYEGSSFLAEVWFSGRKGNRVPVGKAERELRAAGSAPSTVSVETR
jgi:hypothetical protein